MDNFIQVPDIYLINFRRNLFDIIYLGMDNFMYLSDIYLLDFRGKLFEDTVIRTLIKGTSKLVELQKVPIMRVLAKIRFRL